MVEHSFKYTAVGYLKSLMALVAFVMWMCIVASSVVALYVLIG